MVYSKRLRIGLIRRKRLDPAYCTRWYKMYAAFQIEVQIKKRLEDLGWTQSMLAQKVGIPDGNISRILKPGRTPSFKTLFRIAGALGLDVHIHLKPQS